MRPNLHVIDFLFCECFLLITDQQAGKNFNQVQPLTSQSLRAHADLFADRKFAVDGKRRPVKIEKIYGFFDDSYLET
jgi:hypothetical protein